MFKFFLFPISFLLLLLGVQAQSTNTENIFEHVPIPGTIRSSQVTDMVMDKHGLLWIAGDGLFRYDGYKFQSFKEIGPNLKIGGKEIVCLLMDNKEDKLYIGTQSYGIVEYSYVTNTFRSIPSKAGTPIIGMLAQTSDGTVWAGSFANGLYRVLNDSLTIVHDPISRFRLSTSFIAIGNTLYCDKLGKIYRLKNGVLSDSIVLQYPNVDFTITTRITAMTPDHSGKLWLGLERGGVFVYDTLKRDFIKYFPPDKAPFYHRINKIFEDSKGHIWILTKANGLAVYNPQTDSFIHLTKNPLDDNSLSGNNCTSIIEDKSGIIWVGASGDLNKYDPAKIKFHRITYNPYSAYSLYDNMVRGVYEDSSEKLWVGTDGGIIHIIDRKNATLEKIPLKLPGIDQHIVAMYFAELNENIMLIGSSYGFLQIDRKTKKISFYKPFENKIRNRQVRQILKDNDNLYFIHSGSVFIHNLKDGTTKSSREFGNGVVNATTIYLDLKGRLWVGVNNGVSLYHPDTESFQFFEFERDSNLPAGSYLMVLSIQEHQNKLWIGSFNYGLWTLDLNNLKNPEIKNISGNKRLSDQTVYATIADSNGDLWLSTNQGISKYDIGNDLFLNFGLSDGVPNEEFNRLASVHCSNGEIVFGGINGLTIFDPKTIVRDKEDFRPIMLGITQYDKEVQSTYQGLLGKNEITLGSDIKNIDFHFFIPNYRTPKRYETYYQLVGHNPNWVKTEINTIHFANLQPGAYELKIKTVAPDNEENITALSIYLNYPVWQRWWFLLLAGCALTLLIFTIIRSNVKKAKNDRLELEKLLRLRTQEIEKSREDLENLNQKKDVIFSILSHDLRSPLTTLKGFLSLLIDNSELLSKEDIKRHATSIRNSVTSSLDLIDNTLFWSLSQTGNITYTPTAFSLNELLKKINDLYQLTADKKQIKLSIECAEPVKLYADENMTYVTLRNLVSNALKFTPEGRSIQLRVTKNHAFAEISVLDQGIGMNATYIQKLLSEEHLQLKMGTSNEKGTGLGILLCKKFIQINNGKLRIESKEGKGSEFIVSLPLAKA